MAEKAQTPYRSKRSCEACKQRDWLVCVGQTRAYPGRSRASHLHPPKLCDVRYMSQEAMGMTIRAERLYDKSGAGYGNIRSTGQKKGHEACAHCGSPGTTEWFVGKSITSDLCMLRAQESWTAIIRCVLGDKVCLLGDGAQSADG